MVDVRNLDPLLCMQCGKQGKTDIHHTRYDGATLYDLEFICHKCNTQQANKLLL